MEDFDLKVLTDEELQSVTWTGISYDKNNLQSANGLIKNTENTCTIHDTENPFVSCIDLQPIRNIT